MKHTPERLQAEATALLSRIPESAQPPEPGFPNKAVTEKHVNQFSDSFRQVAAGLVHNVFTSAEKRARMSLMSLLPAKYGICNTAKLHLTSIPQPLILLIAHTYPTVNSSS